MPSYLRPGRVPGHSIRWYVYTDDGEKIPRESSMRGAWPGYDVECECGWSSRTGGGVESYVADLVRRHKSDYDDQGRPYGDVRLSETEEV